MSLYIGLNLVILGMPLVLSFDKRVAYVRRWIKVLLSAAIVGFGYLVWDVVATRRGDWAFNDLYSGTIRIFGLPPGEYLFFLTVPFACLFIFEVVKAYFRGGRVKIPSWVVFSCAIGLGVLAVVFRQKDYTVTVLVVSAVFLIIGQVSSLFSSLHFWMFIGISMVPFLIFNGVLTSLPVVEYGSRAIWGVRVYTIPLEDFFYCFTLLGLNALVYSLFTRDRVVEIQEVPIDE